MFWFIGYNLAYGIPEGGFIGTLLPWSDASSIETGYSMDQIGFSKWYFVQQLAQ